MDGIKSFVWSFIAVSVSVGICLAVSPSGNGSNRYLKFIGALCITSFLVSPLKIVICSFDINSVIPEVKTAEISDSDPADLVVSETKKLICEDAAEFIAGKYGVECKNCLAVIDKDENGRLKMSCLYLILNTKSDFLAAEIKREMKNRYGCVIFAEKSEGK